MYPNYQNFNQYKQQYPNDERFIGGFAFPFLLGGVTGAALAPNFWRPPYNRPPLFLLFCFFLSSCFSNYNNFYCTRIL